MRSNQESGDRPGKKRSVLQMALLLGGSAVPLVFLVCLVARRAVPIPALDDWDMMPLILKAREGHLRFYDLFEQQQEARTFFPKLLFILFGLGRHFDGRVAMMFSILVCCLTLLGIYLLLKKSAVTDRAVAVGLILIALLVFSPVQNELWLLASGFSSFMPALYVVWAMVVIRARISVPAKFWLCLALSWLASFTLANGLLAWVITFPVLLAMERVRSWKRWLGAWILACAFCAAIYFWQFRPPDDLPPFAPRKSVTVYLQYLLTFLGSGLGRARLTHPVGDSTGVGAVLLFGYLAASVRAAFRFRDREYCARIFPWLAIGAYSIGSGLLAALGRIEWGVSQSLESRYVAFSLYLTAAMIALAAIFAEEVANKWRDSSARRLVFTAVVLLSATYLILALCSAAGSLAVVRRRPAALRLGRGAVLFSQVLDTSETIRTVSHPRPEFVRQYADLLDQRHLWRTPLMRSRQISQLRHSDANEEFVWGWIDGLSTTHPGKATAWGWAAIDKGHPADCVLLAYRNEQNDWTTFAISSAVPERADVAKSLNDGEQLWSGWRAVFSVDAVPKAARISAWALDAKAGKLYRLKSKEATSHL